MWKKEKVDLFEGFQGKREMAFPKFAIAPTNNQIVELSLSLSLSLSHLYLFIPFFLSHIFYSCSVFYKKIALHTLRFFYFLSFSIYSFSLFSRVCDNYCWLIEYKYQSTV